MATPFQLSRMNLVILVVNLVVLGGCLVLLFITGPSGPLILLTVGTLGLALGKIGTGFLGSKRPAPPPGGT